MIAVLKKQLMKLDFRKLNTQSIEQSQNKTLLNFVPKRSINLLTAFRIDTTFLNDDPITWPSCPAYVGAKQKVASIKVINDCAEPAVKLATDFTNALTHDEAHRQLVIILKHHQQHIAIPLKKNYIYY